MKATKKAIALYIKGLCEHYSISHIFQMSILACATMLIIDYYDFPSRLMKGTPIFVVFVILAASILVTISWLREMNYWDLLKIPSHNALDVCVITGILILCTYAPVQLALFNNQAYKLIACTTLAMVCLVLLIIRIGNLYKAQIEYESRQSNLWDLKTVYDGRFSHQAGEPILVSEADVDYDMLNRDGIINQLYKSIVCSHPEKGYVISLEGPWGCGKTTILNNTKRMIIDSCQGQDYIVIDNFDPWLYGSQEALLLAMFDTLLKRVGMKYSPFRTYRMLDELEKIIAENHVAGSILRSLTFSRTSQVEEVQRIKKRISSFLKFSGKTVVFFIDNLDRANESNIIFLFKLISPSPC